MSLATEVSITIDTEFSIAGAFDSPDCLPVSDPMVSGAVAGREEGLGFLLDLFQKYQTKSTFFVECANYFYFGDEPMQGYVRRIQAAGQDVQLHVHPCWLHFNKNPSIGTFSQNDSCAGRETGELKRIFDLCVRVFERWTGKKPLALRTGSLHVDRTVYRVMAELGIPLSSSIGLGVFRPEVPELQLMSGRHQIEGVMELPVLSYQDFSMFGNPHIKTLQITSCSWPEMKALLWQARRYGVDNVVILTHPFEYFKTNGERFEKLTRNRVNQQRLEKLCRFIHSHPDDFVTMDFASAAERWRAQEEAENICLTMPPWYAVGRKLHNKLNDMVWRY